MCGAIVAEIVISARYQTTRRCARHQSKPQLRAVAATRRRPCFREAVIRSTGFPVRFEFAAPLPKFVLRHQLLEKFPNFLADVDMCLPICRASGCECAVSGIAARRARRVLWRPPSHISRAARRRAARRRARSSAISRTAPPRVPFERA